MAGGLNRTPPHDNEAERAALGAMLFDTEAIDAASQGLSLRAGDFYSPAHGGIYDAILKLRDSGNVKPDILTVSRELRQAGKLDESGGEDYVASLTTVVPTSANIEYYVKIVQDCSLRRSLLRVSSEIGARVFDESLEAYRVLEEVQQKIFELSDSRQLFKFSSAREVVAETTKLIDKLRRDKKAFTGVPSGFTDLDSMTNGFKPSEFIIIGARPSIGKTAIALNMAAHAAAGKKIPTAFFTLEMSDVSLMMRLISSEAQIESNSLRTGYLSNEQMNVVHGAMSKLYDAPLYFVDQPNMRLLDLRSQARRLRANQNVGIIFIDYITLITLEDFRLQPHEQIAEVSRSLKSLARELNIPIVALSQLTREAEKDKPNLATIRASGAIEQDADIVMFLSRQREKGKDAAVNSHPDVIETELSLAKNRNGPTGPVRLQFLPKYAKFVSTMKRDPV
ncbi:MAG: replicative DNA helicase [Treponema sp.]|jgi:replicative DNA helicase|nr:replicative DNA helicase [Treponema sp.]